MLAHCDVLVTLQESKAKSKVSSAFKPEATMAALRVKKLIHLKSFKT